MPPPLQRAITEEHPEGRMRIFAKGKTVQPHPGTPLYVRGVRNGIVTKIGPKYITVQFDGEKKPVPIIPSNLVVIETP